MTGLAYFACALWVVVFWAAVVVGVVWMVAVRVAA